MSQTNKAPQSRHALYQALIDDSRVAVGRWAPGSWNLAFDPRVTGSIRRDFARHLFDNAFPLGQKSYSSVPHNRIMSRLVFP